MPPSPSATPSPTRSAFDVALSPASGKQTVDGAARLGTRCSQVTISVACTSMVVPARRARSLPPTRWRPNRCGFPGFSPAGAGSLGRPHGRPTGDGRGLAKLAFEAHALGRPRLGEAGEGEMDDGREIEREQRREPEAAEHHLGACAAERFCRRSVGSRNQSCCPDIRILLPDPRSGYSFALMVWCCPTRTFCGADS